MVVRFIFNDNQITLYPCFIPLYSKQMWESLKQVLVFFLGRQPVLLTGKIFGVQVHRQSDGVCSRGSALYIYEVHRHKTHWISIALSLEFQRRALCTLYFHVMSAACNAVQWLSPLMWNKGVIVRVPYFVSNPCHLHLNLTQNRQSNTVSIDLYFDVRLELLLHCRFPNVQVLVLEKYHWNDARSEQNWKKIYCSYDFV